MVDTLELPVSIVATFIGSALSIGVTWGLLRGQLKALETAVKSVDEDCTNHGERLRQLELASKAAESQREAIDKLERNMLPRETFNERMSRQDGSLAEIKESLRSKISVSSMRRVDSREEPGSDPPPVPPMRPRLPSRRDGE